MSKLFDTLEQIRRNESYQVPGNSRAKRPKNSVGRERAWFIWSVVVLTIGSMAFLFYQPRFNGGKDDDAVGESVAEVSIRAAASDNSMRPVSGDGDDVVRQNNDAVRYVINHDHWRGIYILSTILDRHPDNIEANVNLSVALMELGLVESGKKYLRRAVEIDRTNPALLKNIAILTEAGLVRANFLESVHDGSG